MSEKFKNTLIEIISNETEDLVHSWIELFDDKEKDDEYRYYDDFLG